MRDPVRSLKLLPWRSLLKYAAITTAIATAFDFLLLLALVYLVPLRKIFSIVLDPPLGIVIEIAIGLGIGALAVYLTERQRDLILNISKLWALIACLILWFWLKTFLPIPTLFLDFSQLTLLGLIIGVFWKGLRYWR